MRWTHGNNGIIIKGLSALFVHFFEAVAFFFVNYLGRFAAFGLAAFLVLVVFVFFFLLNLSRFGCVAILSPHQ